MSKKLRQFSIEPIRCLIAITLQVVSVFTFAISLLAAANIKVAVANQTPLQIQENQFHTIRTLASLPEGEIDLARIMLSARQPDTSMLMGEKSTIQ